MLARYMSDKAFIDWVMCVPSQKYQASLGLVLRKDWETLQLDISYSAMSQGSTINLWMPVSRFKQASSCNSAFRSSDCSGATTLAKVFLLSPGSRH